MKLELLGNSLLDQLIYSLFNCLECLGDWCHVYSTLCALQYTTAHLTGFLFFATDAELYKNMTNMIYSYNTLL